MRHRVGKELYDYWKRLKGARAAPDRSEIDPSAIRHLLADSFIIEVDEAETAFPIRLSGSRLNALWLTEQKGRSFLELWREQDRESLSTTLMMVVRGVSPVVSAVQGGPKGAEPMDFELLLLPLRYFGKTHSRIMGSLAPMRRTSWLGSSAVEPLSLNSMRFIEETDHRAPWGFSKFVAPPPPESQPPRLVVYEGGKSRSRW